MNLKLKIMNREYENHWIAKGIKYFFYAVIGLTIATGLAFVFGFVVMHLWNWLMPELFGLATINFWKAAGIVILARLLFGGFKHGSDHHKSSRHPKMPFGKHPKTKKCGPDSWNDWRYYEAYWEDEGNEAFKAYVKKKKEPTVEAEEDIKEKDKE